MMIREISSSNFLHFDRNLNTGEEPLNRQRMATTAGPLALIIGV